MKCYLQIAQDLTQQMRHERLIKHLAKVREHLRHHVFQWQHNI